MKQPFLSSWTFALTTVLGATFVALPARAQDGAAPPPSGEPVNPWQSTAPSGSDTPPASPPPATPPPGDAKPGDSAATPGVPPTGSSPSHIYLPTTPEATAAGGQKQKDKKDEEPDDGKLRHHQDHWLGFLGFRVGKVSSEGYDPFAESDELAQISLGLGRTLVSSGNFSLAGLFLYDLGGRSGTARGAESSLTIHRLTFGAEGRYHFIRQLFVFARVAPGTVHSIATITDDSVGVEIGARDWVFATDFSAGAMFELTGWSGGSRKRQVGLWITLDGGYGVATESDLVLKPESGEGPERPEPVDLGPLALSGPFMRSALVLTY